MDKLLLYGQNRTAIEFIRAILEPEDCSITIAGTEHEAFKLLDEVEFQLVLLDMEMPNAAGLQLLGMIRQKKSQQELPVLALFHTSDQHKIEQVLSAGANDYIENRSVRVAYQTKVRNLVRLQNIYMELVCNNRQIDEILNNIPIVSLVVDSDVKVQCLNHTGQQVVAKPHVLGLLSGDVFDCINALSEGGACGKTKNCARCIIRNSVNASANLGISVHKKEGIFTVRKDGVFKELNVLVSTSPIKFKNKDSVLLSIDDVTIETQAVKDVQKLLSNEIEINKQLQSQTAKLKQITDNLNMLNDQLVDSEEKVQRQNEQLLDLNATKDKFFSIIAHDLRNPFNGILGLSSMLLKNINVYPLDDISRWVKQISMSAQGAYDLLENLLDWSKTQTGRIEFKPKVFELQDLITEILEITSSISMSKNIKICYEMPESVSLYADRNMIDTILRNLVINAVKFTREEGLVRIVVACSQDDVAISVIDNGVGIEPSRIGDLFKINEKTSTLGTANERGTGLGLILCDEFVRKHGGRIWVESEVDKGSSFKFTIPVHKHSNQK